MRRQQRIESRDGSIASVAATNGSSSEQDGNSQGIEEQDGDPQGDKRMKYSGPIFSEDILHHIHSLLPLRDAARVAHVSHAFLNSWRSRPNLHFSIKALDLEVKPHRDDEVSRDFATKVDHILKHHSGVGLKTLSLSLNGCGSVNCSYLDSWIHLAVTSGIKELILILPARGPEYNFPCSLLSGKGGDCIQHLLLNNCTFRPTIELGCLRSLTRLSLWGVSVTGDELGCLLSKSCALELLELTNCHDISCLKIPHLLLRLSSLKVFRCCNLKVIESEAPNLSTFCFTEYSNKLTRLSLGEALQVKKLEMFSLGAACYSRADLPTIVPNLETLTIYSICEMASIPIVPNKFRLLKYLNIHIPRVARHPAYDYFSLASFLDASPSLEHFILRINGPEGRVEHGLFSGDPSHLQQMPGHRHEKLKRVKIDGFFPAKSLLELALFVLKTATSLESLTLVTTFCCSCWEPDSDPSKCFLVAIRKYIQREVPATARLDVEGPCSGLRVKLYLAKYYCMLDSLCPDA